jgi:hypothetical protein
MVGRRDLEQRIELLEATLRRVDRCIGDACRACHADIRDVLGGPS